MWEWSHTQDAYDNAEFNLRALPKETLEIIFAEWRASQEKHESSELLKLDPNFDLKKYDKALKYAKTLSDDDLCDFIWEKTSEQATCENGGFDAWVCPYGCHRVSFSLPEEQEQS